MAFVHGKGSAVSIDGHDLSAYSNSVTFTRTTDTHDITTFGQNAHVYAPGLTDATGSIEGIYDSTALNGPGAVLRPLVGAATVTMLWKPEGAGTGKPQSSVSVLVTSYEESSAVADMVMWSAQVQMSGTITNSTL